MSREKAQNVTCTTTHSWLEDKDVRTHKRDRGLSFDCNTWILLTGNHCAGVGYQAIHRLKESFSPIMQSKRTEGLESVFANISPHHNSWERTERMAFMTRKTSAIAFSGWETIITKITVIFLSFKHFTKICVFTFHFGY